MSAIDNAENAGRGNARQDCRFLKILNGHTRKRMLCAAMLLESSSQSHATQQQESCWPKVFTPKTASREDNEASFHVLPAYHTCKTCTKSHEMRTPAILETERPPSGKVTTLLAWATITHKMPMPMPYVVA